MEVALRAIAEPHRRDILRLVYHSELSDGEIASHFTLTRPAISQHLAVLIQAGLLVVRQQGTRRFYRARPEGVAELRRFLEEFWEERPEMLKQEAQAEERRASSGGR